MPMERRASAVQIRHRSEAAVSSNPAKLYAQPGKHAAPGNRPQIGANGKMGSLSDNLRNHCHFGVNQARLSVPPATPDGSEPIFDRNVKYTRYTDQPKNSCGILRRVNTATLRMQGQGGQQEKSEVEMAPAQLRQAYPQLCTKNRARNKYTGPKCEST